MNYNYLKNVYRNIPLSLQKYFSYVPFFIIGGPSYITTKLQLNYFDTLDLEQKISIRNKKLIKYLNDAIQFTPFYKDFAKKNKINLITDVEQLELFPIISKNDIDGNLDLFTDIRFIKKKYKVSTGGSTGSQIDLYLSNNCFSKEWAFVNNYIQNYGVNINSNRFCLRGVQGIDKDNFIGFNPLYKEMLVSPFKLSHDNIESNFDILNKFDAKWIHGYPSSVSEFSRLLLDMDITFPNIDHILLVSEKIYSSQINLIKKAFDSDILSFYGMSERLIFAPLHNGSFWPHYMYGVCEEIDNELIGTGFINDALRLIRYRTSDSAITNKIDGFVHEISSIEGRWGRDYLLGINNTKISMTALNVHCDSLSLVKKFQFLQNNIGCCDLLIVPSNNLIDADVRKIVNAFKSKVGDELIISPVLVDDIPLSPRGKHAFIKNFLI